MNIVNLSEKPDIVDILAACHYREWCDLYPGETQEGFKNDLLTSLSPEAVPTTFIAIDNNALLDSISILHKDMDTDEPWTPWLGNLYVHPDYRQQGIGKQLINHLLVYCAAHGVDQLYLFTPASRTYYERLGWQVIQSLDYHGQKVDIMHQTL